MKGGSRIPIKFTRSAGIHMGNRPSSSRDAGAESYDPPPVSVEPSGPLVRLLVESESNGADDLRRADDAQQSDSYDPKKANQTAFDVIDLHSRP